MRGRLLAAVLIVLCVVLAAVWKTRRPLAPPPAPPAQPTIATPLTPPTAPPVSHAMPRPSVPAPKKTIPKISKKTGPAKKPAAPLSAAPPLETLPPVPELAPAPAAPEPQEWKGNNDTSITHSGQIVVENDHQWVRFWAEHHPHEAAPEIDFTRSMVVGVFLGQRPADGFRVVITGVRTLADAVVVDYIELAPPPGTFQVAVEAFPYDIKVIPHSTLHVKFNELKAQYQKSSPPLGSR